MLLDEIKRIAKDGADLSGIEKMLSDLDPLKNIQSKEDALAFIDRNQVFKAALDSETSRRVENALGKFQSEKLPEILKEKQTEWAKIPEETPEQKRIRELEEQLQKDRAEAAEARLRAELQEKARALGYNNPNVDRYTVYGEKAIEYLEQDFKHTQGLIESQVKDTVKKRFGASAIDEQPKNVNAITRKQFSELSPQQQMAHVKSGGTVAED